ncbi:acetamidase/formamidase family protein [Tepidibacillus infernus]|uniref:Acetamidase n=1 Tax=Tepidibacillus decaturensis TaxID=1413211 RepID=A0A135L6G5_9BACI|nr:acetamidase/formamidase family protein [Tepidibacillus decaturensis]KXG44601.1 acetamidase [Tepidibacillus decaturensis]
MKKSLSCSTASIYSFSAKHQPMLEVEAGTQVVLETYDCFTNQITSSDTPFNSIDWQQINPATGPVFVKEAQPGDILKVTIDEIELADQGVMATGPGLGVMGDEINTFTTKMISIQNGKAVFDEDLQIPLNPMIGVIGVAPEEGDIPCGAPGPHGGNMDNKMITKGATLYFPVFVEGALFALGDLHAAMGDGEIGVSGVEIPGKVTVTLDVIKGQSIAYPFLENDDVVTSIVSKETLDEAVKGSVKEMANRLQPKFGLSVEDLTMLLSAVGQTQICQVVDPLMTARFVVPKWVLQAKKVTLF